MGTWNLVPEALPASGQVALSAARGPGAQAGPDIEARFFHFQRVIPTGTGRDVFTFLDVAAVVDGDWRAIGDPEERTRALDVRPVTMEYLTRDPDTGFLQLIVRQNVLVADLPGGVTVMWDVWDGE